jgi:hypothetical protein
LGDQKDVRDKPLVAAQSATGEKYPMKEEFRCVDWSFHSLFFWALEQ